MFKDTIISSSLSFSNLLILHTQNGQISSFINNIIPLVEMLTCVPYTQLLSCVQLFATPWTVQPTRLLCLWNSPGKNTGVGCHFLLQWIFPVQRLNPHLLCLLHWQACSLPLSHLLMLDITAFKAQAVGLSYFHAFCLPKRCNQPWFIFQFSQLNIEVCQLFLLLVILFISISHSESSLPEQQH